MLVCVLEWEWPVPETMLNGMIEMDESYFGGKPRKFRKNEKDNVPSLSNLTEKRGRGTKKVSVVGMVQRKEQVKTKVIEKLTKRNLLAMLKQNAKQDNSILITDNFKSYDELETYIDKFVINHSKAYSKDIVQINAIEVFGVKLKTELKAVTK